jgi:hypothetical protein
MPSKLTMRVSIELFMVCFTTAIIAQRVVAIELRCLMKEAAVRFFTSPFRFHL